MYTDFIISITCGLLGFVIAGLLMGLVNTFLWFRSGKTFADWVEIVWYRYFGSK